MAQRGDDLGISIELDDVRNGKQLWGQQYSRKVADLLMLQNDIAKEVSQRLRSQLSPAEQQKLTLGSTGNPEAYQLFLKGEYYSGRFTKEGFDKGIDYLNQALAKDPNYAEAYSALANNYINQDDWFITPRQAGPRARDEMCIRDSANGNPTGSGKVRQTTTMSGNSYSGSGDYAYYDVDGNVVASGTFTITAKRILVQAPKQ